MTSSESDTSDCSFSSTHVSAHRDRPPNLPPSDGVHHFGDGFKQRYIHLQRWRSMVDRPNSFFDYCSKGIIGIWHAVGEIQWKGPLEGIGDEWQREHKECLNLALRYVMWREDWVRRAVERKRQNEREEEKDARGISREEVTLWKEALEARKNERDVNFEKNARGRLWIETQRIPLRQENERRSRREVGGHILGRDGHHRPQELEDNDDEANGAVAACRFETDCNLNSKDAINNRRSGGFDISGLKW